MVPCPRGAEMAPTRREDATRGRERDDRASVATADDSHERTRGVRRWRERAWECTAGLAKTLPRPMPRARAAARGDADERRARLDARRARSRFPARVGTETTVYDSSFAFSALRSGPHGRSVISDEQAVVALVSSSSSRRRLSSSFGHDALSCVYSHPPVSRSLGSVCPPRGPRRRRVSVFLHAPRARVAIRVFPRSPPLLLHHPRLSPLQPRDARRAPPGNLVLKFFRTHGVPLGYEFVVQLVARSFAADGRVHANETGIHDEG